MRLCHSRRRGKLGETALGWGRPPKRPLKLGSRNSKSKAFFSLHQQTGEMLPVSGARPTNQNARSVQLKVAGRIKAIPKALRRDTTHLFYEGIQKGQQLSDNDLHMAHGVSAQELKLTVAATFNAYRKAAFNPKKQKMLAKEAANFAAGFITTDAEDEPEVRKTAREMLMGNRAERIGKASQLLTRLNRSSGNLIGADGPTNSAIGDKNDQATTRDDKVIAFMERRRQVTNRLQKKLGIATTPFPAVKNQDGTEKTSTMDYQ